ncbi:Thermostable beta-glucosidase B [subsurface metagenome]
MAERKLKWDKLIGLSEEEINQKAQEILSHMTIKEKTWQMVGDGELGIHDESSESSETRYNYKPVPAGVDKNLGIPGIEFTDGPRGVALGNSTCFPVSMARGATWDLELEKNIGNAIGIEAKAQGANYFGGVCINLLRHPAWGRAQETYGEDTFHLGAFGVALIKGTQKHVMSCAKHYACNSMENMRFDVDVKIDERTLREVYLWHFKKCVEAGVTSIMNAYNKVNGKYCGHNSHLLRDILKTDWNFKGFVVTDFVRGIRNGMDAINAGVDIEMPFGIHMKPIKLKRLLEKGKISEEQINEAVLRILRLKLKFAHEGDPAIYNTDKVACKKHIQLALDAARKSIVLLKNEESLLPLRKKNIKKIAVMGKLADTPNIGDNGSSRVYPPYVITPLEGIKNSAGNTIEIMHNDGGNLEDVEKLARQTDAVIIVVGNTSNDEGEYIPPLGGDRDSLELDEEDEKLILAVASANKKSIVVLEGGSSIIVESWKDNVPAILMAWYPGMEGGTAIGEIIFGKFNPCGKLPIVFPKSEDQLPFFDKYAKSIEYGYYHGYKLMDKNGYEPAFPFGHGLSYTTYTYKNLRKNKEAISKNAEIEFNVDITNDGHISGEEIVQLYISYNNSSVDRPIKELKGFGKVYLNPGEIKTLTLNLKAEDLSYYDSNKKKWVIEPIEYIAHVGPSSKEESFISTSFRIT